MVTCVSTTCAEVIIRFKLNGLSPDIGWCYKNSIKSRRYCMFDHHTAGKSYFENLSKFSLWGQSPSLCFLFRWVESRGRRPTALRPRPKVELFMRRTELSESSSWKVRCLAQLSSSERVWIVQHVLSVPFRFWRIQRASEDRLRDKRRSTCDELN